MYFKAPNNTLCYSEKHLRKSSSSGGGGGGGGSGSSSRRRRRRSRSRSLRTQDIFLSTYRFQ